MGPLSFLNPGLLWGIAAIAAPIIIFLLIRFRYRTVEWAALLFLQRALKKQQRRLRLENLLLLLIRCLLLALFAVVLARPHLEREVAVQQDETRRNVVLLFDTSYSMGYQVGGDETETAYERARQVARELVGELRTGDRLNVVAFDDAPRVLYPKGPQHVDARVKTEILQNLEDAPELKLSPRGPSERGTDLAAALADLPYVLKAFDLDDQGRPPPPGAPPLKKTVYLLSDLQRQGFLDRQGALVNKGVRAQARAIKELGASLIVIDCGAEEPRNVSITHLATREMVVGKNLPFHVECVVKNWSGAEMRDLSVEYFVDGKPTSEKTVSVSIPPHQEVIPDPLVHKFFTVGPHRVMVRVKSDRLTLDNERHLVVDVKEQVRALLVDGEPFREQWKSETDFLAAGLSLSEHVNDAGRGLIAPEVIRDSQLSSTKLSGYDVVVVANVDEVSAEAAKALDEYASQGGSLVLAVGALVRPDSYNERLWREGAGVLPAKLLRVLGKPTVEAQDDGAAQEWVMVLGDYEPGHAVAHFADKEMAAFLRPKPSVFAFYQVELPPKRDGAPGVSVPLRLVPRPQADAVGGRPTTDVQGEPLLVERRHGRGRVLAWLSTVDAHWNTTPIYDTFYVPFWQLLVQYLTQRAGPLLNLEIGDRYERIVDEYGRIEVEAPGREGVGEGVVLRPLDKKEQRPGDKQDLYRMTYPPSEDRGGLQQRGFYAVTRRGLKGERVASEHFAVTIDAREGDLTKLSLDELREALDQLPAAQVRYDAAKDSLQGDAALAGTREYWRELLALVIGLLVLESVLAATFGRRRAQ